jgi:hypothetical protein
MAAERVERVEPVPDMVEPDDEPDEVEGCPLYLVKSAPTLTEVEPIQAKAPEHRPEPARASTGIVEPRRRHIRGQVVFGSLANAAATPLVVRASHDRGGHRLLVVTVADRDGVESAPAVLGVGSAVSLLRKLAGLIGHMGSSLDPATLAPDREPAIWRDHCAPRCIDESPAPVNVGPVRDIRDRRDDAKPAIGRKGAPPASFTRTMGGKR